MTAATAVPLPDAATAPGFRRSMVVISGVLGSFIYFITLLSVSLALPQLQGAFSAAPDQVAWLLTSFILGTTAVITATGWLATRFGRKRVFLVAIAGFTIASLLCGLAGSLTEEVIYRTLQGAFGAPLMPIGQAIVLDAYPPKKNGLATAIWSAGALSGGVFGPLAGGYLVELFNWSWIFYINLPIGALAFLGTWFFVPEIAKDRGRRLDWVGLLALLTGMIALTMMLNRGERLGWFASTEIIIEAAVTAFAFYAYVAHSLTTAKPFLDLGLFRDRNYMLNLIFVAVFGGIVIMPTFFLPILMQQFGGYSITLSGVLVAVRTVSYVGWSLMLSPFLDRIDPRIAVFIRLLMVAGPTWSMSDWTLDIRVWDVVWTSVLQGIGSGFIYSPVAMMAFSTLPTHLRTEGMSLFHLMLNLASSIGVAGMFYLLVRYSQVNHEVLAAHVNPYNELFRGSAVWDLSEPSTLAAIESEISRQAGMIAFNNNFLLLAIMAVAAIPLLLLIRLPRR